VALERYAAYRYGEDVPASTIRSFKQRKKIVSQRVDPEEMWPKVQSGDVLPDVIGLRAQMIELQRKRIAIDWGHEQSMNKLFGSTKGEIAELGRLLDALKGDLQDVGVMGKAGEKIEVSGRVEGPTPEQAPLAKTLGDLLGTADPGAEMELAKVLHLAATNGHRANGGEAAG